MTGLLRAWAYEWRCRNGWLALLLSLMFGLVAAVVLGPPSSMLENKADFWKLLGEEAWFILATFVVLRVVYEGKTNWGGFATLTLVTLAFVAIAASALLLDFSDGFVLPLLLIVAFALFIFIAKMMTLTPRVYLGGDGFVEAFKNSLNDSRGRLLSLFGMLLLMFLPAFLLMGLVLAMTGPNMFVSRGFDALISALTITGMVAAWKVLAPAAAE